MSLVEGELKEVRVMVTTSVVIWLSVHREELDGVDTQYPMGNVVEKPIPLDPCPAVRM